jgi:hypothetical protein
MVGMVLNRAALGRAIFRLARIQRIHIVGCARSGTTMLHLAMACFDRVILCPTESKAPYPYFRERIELGLRLGAVPGPKHYVTKRGFEWHKPDRVAELLRWTLWENIGIIHLVRDPRDVLVSRASSLPNGPYVWYDRWYDSIRAADSIFEALVSHPRKIIVRYEDIVLQPEAVQQRIASTFGLRVNSRALLMNRVKDNFERLGLRYDAQQLMALNGLRNMDANSIGNWRTRGVPNFGNMKPEMRTRFEAFCREHGYEDACARSAADAWGRDCAVV